MNKALSICHLCYKNPIQTISSCKCIYCMNCIQNIAKQKKTHCPICKQKLEFKKFYWLKEKDKIRSIAHLFSPFEDVCRKFVENINFQRNQVSQYIKNLQNKVNTLNSENKNLRNKIEELKNKEYARDKDRDLEIEISKEFMRDDEDSKDILEDNNEDNQSDYNYDRNKNDNSMNISLMKTERSSNIKKDRWNKRNNLDNINNDSFNDIRHIRNINNTSAIRNDNDYEEKNNITPSLNKIKEGMKKISINKPHYSNEVSSFLTPVRKRNIDTKINHTNNISFYNISNKNDINNNINISNNKYNPFNNSISINNINNNINISNLNQRTAVAAQISSARGSAALNASIQRNRDNSPYESAFRNGLKYDKKKQNNNKFYYGHEY